jgi:hypothetical protein
MAKKKACQQSATSILDYPSKLSLYERESLAADAKLAARKKKPKSDSAKQIFRIK